MTRRNPARAGADAGGRRLLQVTEVLAHFPPCRPKWAPFAVEDFIPGVDRDILQRQVPIGPVGIVVAKDLCQVALLRIDFACFSRSLRTAIFNSSRLPKTERQNRSERLKDRGLNSNLRQ